MFNEIAEYVRSHSPLLPSLERGEWGKHLGHRREPLNFKPEWRACQAIPARRSAISSVVIG